MLAFGLNVILTKRQPGVTLAHTYTYSYTYTHIRTLKTGNKTNYNNTIITNSSFDLWLMD